MKFLETILLIIGELAKSAKDDDDIVLQLMNERNKDLKEKHIKK